MIYYRVEGYNQETDRVEYFWETTQIKEKARREELVKKGYKDVTMTNMDIPTVSKPDFTEWLQENISGKE